MEEGYTINDEDHLGRNRHDANGGLLLPNERNSEGDDLSSGTSQIRNYSSRYGRRKSVEAGPLGSTDEFDNSALKWVAAGVMVLGADDASGVGVVDDVLIPVIVQ